MGHGPLITWIYTCWSWWYSRSGWPQKLPGRWIGEETTMKFNSKYQFRQKNNAMQLIKMIIRNSTIHIYHIFIIFIIYLSYIYHIFIIYYSCHHILPWNCHLRMSIAPSCSKQHRYGSNSPFSSMMYHDVPIGVIGIPYVDLVGNSMYHEFGEIE